MIKSSILLFTLLVLLSCNPHYAPGILYSRTPNLTPPVNNGKAVGVSMDYNNTIQRNENESNQIIMMHNYFAKRSDNRDYGVGYFIYYGQFNVNELPDYKGVKPYYGIGLEYDGKLYLNKIKHKIGIGLYMRPFLEFGDYTEFRKEGHKLNILENNYGFNGSFYAAANIFYEYKWKKSKLEI